MIMEDLLKPCRYQVLRKIYITMFILAVFTRVLMPIASHETQLMNSIVFSIVAVFGAFVITFDLCTEKIMLKQKNIIWLILALASCIISSILNIKYGIWGNVRNLVWMSISFFVLYPTDQNRSKNDIRDEIQYVSNILTFVWFFACFISLIMFFLNIGYYIDIYPDSFSRQGFIECRLFGIFEDPNFAAVVSILMIILSIWNLSNGQKRIMKVFYIFNIVIQFLYIVLSGSRTAEVSFALVIAITSYFLLKESECFKRAGIIIKNTLFVFISLCISALLIISMNFTGKVISYVPAFIESQFGTYQSNTVITKKPVNIIREDVVESTDVSNCRFRIWESALELFRSAPIFGTSPRNMRTYAKVNFSEGFIAKHSYAVHNAYIDVLTSMGLVGATFIAIFFVLYLIELFRYLFTSKNKRNYKMIVLCLAIVTTVASSAMFLSEIFFVNTIGVLMFWLYLGYTYYFISEEAINKVEEQPVGAK